MTGDGARVPGPAVGVVLVSHGRSALDLLDAARTSRTIQQNYIEALFSYQRNVFLLESAVGREVTS